MNGMIERVADAVFAELGADVFDEEGNQLHPLASLRRSVGPETGFEGRCYVDGYIDLRALARAVLTAMREPTQGMVEAGEGIAIYHPDDIIGNQAEPIYHAMIDAALS